MAVHTTREHDARNGRYRGGLGGAAIRAVAAVRRRRSPDLFSGNDVESEKTASDFRIHCSPGRGTGRGRHEGDIGNSRVEVLSVRSRAPLDTPERAAASDAGLPQDLALAIRIE